ncbi:MAG TPA: Eco47II family restriction endonuclease [Candidatus Thiothrix moscowensis]|uniref:Eco47II family restriction endonuclease n=1 Tax=unclassified Thiothrix TaxID=2636184 RepID=UPI0025EE55D0|nr:MULTISPECIES: Eco47II family restriction endonuclease [unclassified Thiothrix]HRJ51901.1 Eco47II family restriction endonuclease [Candidatus Thiothrix moscowensis]HRJ92216.1 Eco47II family restriction endonuclease [Candidatus Thiothrix moscowensis]
MPILSFISDEVLTNAVKNLLDVAVDARKKADKGFNRNVIDPFAVLFEMSGFQVDEQAWLVGEKNRQAQKTLQNHVGTFHQTIIGNISGWEDLGTGGVVDVVCPDRKIIAEIKNKHNTVKGSDKVKVYDLMERSVMTKGHQYKGFTGYYVEVIPKSTARYDKPFTPPDNQTGQPRAANELIRQIDGYKFYALATGVPDALGQLFAALPDVIENCSAYRFTDRTFASKFFQKAFG